MSKYYTPTPDEFHIGFEYEIFEDFDTLPERKWHKLIMGYSGTGFGSMGYHGNCEEGRVRVKYLDAEGMEEFCEELSKKTEFKYKQGYDCMVDDAYVSGFILNNHYLLLGSNHTLIIKKLNLDGETVFFGTIKNKSELLRLIKQLEI